VHRPGGRLCGCVDLVGLDQLDALRSRGRVVGVISHVTEMKDWVHDRVIVEAGRPGQGSRLIQPD
jgi:DNA repair exonuclease SbcCD ATPase subunit